MTHAKKPHRNAEKVVKCPVDGCEAEKLARGMHLHVLRSVGDGHGEQGEIPEDVDLRDLEEVGTQEVELDYPEERNVETVARLCPYCRKPFKGKHGVLIHLGQVAGRKNHPANASEIHESTDFPVVELDEDENVVATISGSSSVYTEGNIVEAESDEGAVYATFSKEELDHLTKVIYSETEDEVARRILQRKYLNRGSR